MKYILFIFVLLFSPLAHAAGEGIAAIVNSDAITNSDVDSRLRLIAASTGMQQTPEVAAKLRPQVVDMLVDEQLKDQEARRLKVEVSPEEIEKGFTEIAGNNNIPVDKFKEMIAKSGISTTTMQRQIKAQIAWSKVIQKAIRSNIEVTDSDIDAELAKFKTKIGQTQYHLSEIYIPVTNAKNWGKAQDFVTKLTAQLRQQPEAFPKAAQQFSQAPGAKKGGDAGWRELGQFPQELQGIISALEPDQITDPVKTTSGFYILVLREKRQITEAMTPKREEVLDKVGTERLERAARRYLLDLRSASFIEIRDQQNG